MVKAALEKAIPLDGPMQMGWRESAKLVPNWRFMANTSGIEWVVDVYCGGYCYVSVGRHNETLRSIPAVVRFLRTYLEARARR